MEKRYEIDILIQLQVTTYQQIGYYCPEKNGELLRGEFSAHIKGTKQYGSVLSAFAVTLNTECTVSINKIHGLLMSLVGTPVSTVCVKLLPITFREQHGLD